MMNRRNNKKPYLTKRRVKNSNRFLAWKRPSQPLSLLWVLLNRLSTDSNNKYRRKLSHQTLNMPTNNKLKGITLWDRELTWPTILLLQKTQSVNLASNSIKKSFKSRLKIENAKKMRKNARLRRRRSLWRGKCNNSNRSWSKERSVSCKKKDEARRRRRKRGMSEEIYLSRVVKMLAHSMGNRRESLSSRDKKNPKSGSSLQH